MATTLHYREDSPNPGMDTPSFVTIFRDSTRSAVSKKRQPIMISSLDHIADSGEHPSLARPPSKRNSNTSSLSAQRMKSVLYKRIRKGSSNSSPNRANSIRSNHSSLRREKPIYNTDGDIPPPLPPKSPDLLVRRRSLHSRSRSSNPVRRLFQKLFRVRRSKAEKPAYSYSKAELRRQLSFDIPGYSDSQQSKYLQYRLKTKDLLRFRPAVRQSQTTLKSKIGDPTNPVHVNASPDAERPLSPQMVQALNISKPSTPTVPGADKPLGKHKRPNLSLPRAKRPQHGFMAVGPPPSIAAPVTSSARAEVLGETAGISLLDPVSSVSRQPSSRRERRIQENHLYREASVRRSATRASRHGNLPIIRRVDVYGTENPTVLLNKVKPHVLPATDAFEHSATVDEAMNFVTTWSGYLRNAIAIRIKLQQEIKQWEAQEEESWRQSSEFADSDGNRSLSSRSSMESISTTASSNGEQEFYSGDQYEPLHSNSSLAKPESPAQRYSPVGSDRDSFMYQIDRPPTNFSFRDMFRDSLDPKRMSSKYSLLIGDKGSFKGDDEASDSSYGSVAKPDHESSWLAAKPKTRRGHVLGRSVSASIKKPRPLPEIPISTRSASSPSPAHVSQTMPSSPELTHVKLPSIGNPGEEGSRKSDKAREKSWSADDTTRSWSDRILKDMYSELGELQMQSSELSELIRTSDSSPANNSGTSDYSVPKRVTQHEEDTVPHDMSPPGVFPVHRSFPTPHAVAESSGPQVQTLVSRSARDFSDTLSVSESNRNIPSALGFNDSASYTSARHSSGNSASSNSSGLRRGKANRRRSRQGTHTRNISIDSAWKTTDSDTSSLTSFGNSGLAIVV